MLLLPEWYLKHFGSIRFKGSETLKKGIIECFVYWSISVLQVPKCVFPCSSLANPNQSISLIKTVKRLHIFLIVSSEVTKIRQPESFNHQSSGFSNPNSIKKNKGKIATFLFLKATSGTSTQITLMCYCQFAIVAKILRQTSAENFLPSPWWCLMQSYVPSLGLFLKIMKQSRWICYCLVIHPSLYLEQIKWVLYCFSASATLLLLSACNVCGACH